MGKARYTEEFKVEAVKQVTDRGHAVAEVAARLGVNANLVHRWRRAAERAPASISSAPAFLPLVMPTASPVTPSPLPASPLASGEIRIELRRGSATVSVSWPASAASDCGAWLSEWLH